MLQSMQTLTSQGTQEWYTPSGVIELARTTMGSIDLDPASSEVAQRWIKAGEYRTLDLSEFKPNPNWSKETLAAALKQLSLAQLMQQSPWHGNVWLNPPFDSTRVWVNRARLEHIWCNTLQTMMLVNTATGYDWYEELWRIYPVCCLRKRLCFANSEGISNPNMQAKKGQTIVYIGDNVDKFSDLWSPYGRVFMP